MFISLLIIIGVTLAFISLLGLIVYAVQYTLAVATEKALNTTEQWKQMRQQDAQRAQEPQNVLLRAGRVEDAQPHTLVRPAMKGEETPPETLLRPANVNEQT